MCAVVAFRYRALLHLHGSMLCARRILWPRIASEYASFVVGDRNEASEQCGSRAAKLYLVRDTIACDGLLASRFRSRLAASGASVLPPHGTRQPL
jgi:hypothetical protein